MLANLSIGTVGVLLLVLYDLLVARGVRLPGGDLRTPLAAVFVLVVLALGSWLTYRWVELPTGASGERRRSRWALLLGFFAALPITYLLLVLAFVIVRPTLD